MYGNKKIKLFCIILSFFVFSMFSVACGKDVEKVDEFASDLELVENDSFTNKDYVTIKKNSVFYDGPYGNITKSIIIGTPKGTIKNNVGYSYKDENIEYSSTTYMNIFDMFVDDDFLKAMVTDSLTSMDDKNAVYTRYVFETLYTMAIRDLELEDSLAYTRGVYQTNNVDYFTIKGIQCSKDEKIDLLFFIEDDVASIITLKYNFNNEESLIEREDFIKSIIAEKYVKISKECETELYVWRPAPETITIVK